MIEVDKTNFDSEIREFAGTMLVDYWGDGCVPCEALKPHIHGFEEVYGDKIKFASVKLQGARRDCIKEGVAGLPVIAIYQGGKMVDSKVKEEATPESVEEMIKKYYK